MDKKRILIAEDDVAICRMLVQTLSSDYDVHWARNGSAALRLAQQVSPHLLLLDVMMPGLDGMQASRLIRRLRGLTHVPIIFLTAKDEPADIIKGIQYGARHYVTKPFKVFDLYQKIKKILAE
jgi:DNA-binding response OmpR family regulator